MKCFMYWKLISLGSLLEFTKYKKRHVCMPYCRCCCCCLCCCVFSVDRGTDSFVVGLQTKNPRHSATLDLFQALLLLDDWNKSTGACSVGALYIQEEEKHGLHKLLKYIYTDTGLCRRFKNKVKTRPHR